MASPLGKTFFRGLATGVAIAALLLVRCATTSRTAGADGNSIVACGQHVQADKSDPGPAMQWDHLLRRAEGARR